MGWTVRQATPDAAPIIHEIARESWHAAYDDFLGPETVDEVVTTGTRSTTSRRRSLRLPSATT